MHQADYVNLKHGKKMPQIHKVAKENVFTSMPSLAVSSSATSRFMADDTATIASSAASSPKTWCRMDEAEFGEDEADAD